MLIKSVTLYIKEPDVDAFIEATKENQKKSNILFDNICANNLTVISGMIILVCSVE
jgi:hypothetical protein